MAFTILKDATPVDGITFSKGSTLSEPELIARVKAVVVRLCELRSQEFRHSATVFLGFLLFFSLVYVVNLGFVAYAASKVQPVLLVEGGELGLSSQTPAMIVEIFPWVNCGIAAMLLLASALFFFSCVRFIGLVMEAGLLRRSSIQGVGANRHIREHVDAMVQDGVLQRVDEQ